jgi:methylenetetrahydrofolate dehydrogenase (NADP+)/methenyltetrahydrofolate cyclohydrolase
MRSFHHELPATTPQAELDALIERLNDDPDVHGILIQSPLPEGLDEQRAFGLVDPNKDVDGFHPWNVGQLVLGRPGLRSCTPAGVMELLRDQRVDLVGANATVIGRSNIVGKPLSLMLLAAHCTVTIMHSRTRELAAQASRADILVAAIGRPAFVTREFVKPGATVIDVGINTLTEQADVDRIFPEGSRKRAHFAAKGRVLVGDVHPEVEAVAGAITPVPGGVGPLTVAMVLRNTVTAAELRAARKVAS